MDDSADERQTLVVVGNGMMSFRLCQRLLDCAATPGPLELVVFGEEPRPAYDRVRLTELFGDRPEEDLRLAPPSWYRDHGIDLRLGDPVVSIDRAECMALSASGATVPFDRLVLATGSRPFVPPIPGADLPGVLVYRTVDDLYAIQSHARRAKRAAVIGGGLLGLEIAKAVHEIGLEVHVVEASPGLLPRQLDDTGARLLRTQVEAIGLRIHTGARTARIEGEGLERVITLAGGEQITVDLVVLAAGIRPRDELARAAGIVVAEGGGVLVDDHLTTSDPRIFAVGECASHRGVTYGLAVPGYRMIDVLVDNLVGGSAVFEGADRSARLKVAGVSVAAVGRYREVPGTQAQTYLAGGVYRKLVLREGRIVGALAVGEWPDLDRVRDAIAEPRGLSFWDLRRFRSTGSLWLKSESPPVHEWPPEALVCGCLGIRRGALTEAELSGCETAAALSARTGAGTMCGSCRPLLVELVQRARVDSMPPARLEVWSTMARVPPEPVHEGAGPRSTRAATMRPPPELEPAPESGGAESPPTLRCSALPDTPPRAPVASTRAPVSLPAPRPAPTSVVPSPLVTLPSLDIGLLTMTPSPSQRGRGEAAASPMSGDGPPPVSETMAPSSRRDSMAALRPISVPPSRMASLAPGYGAEPGSAGRSPIVNSQHLQRSGAPPAREERSLAALLVAGVAAAAGTVAFALAPPASPARSFRGLHAEVLWTHRSGRLASGYVMVALLALGMAISLRKRWPRFTFGNVAGLRAVHGVLGALALAGLAFHTGLHGGERLNRLLTLDFLAATAVGGVAAAATAISGPRGASSMRLLFTRAHLFILVPLPVLLVLHVVGAYYF